MYRFRSAGPARVTVRRDLTIVQLPYAPDNRAFLGECLRGRRGAGLTWNPGPRVWTLKRRLAEHMVEQLLRFYPTVVLTVENVRNSALVCDVRCATAKGLECVCSCGGANHGTDLTEGRWNLVGGTRIVLVEDVEMVQRVLQSPFALAGSVA